MAASNGLRTNGIRSTGAAASTSPPNRNPANPPAGRTTTDVAHGLSEAQAVARLASEGYNELPARGRSGIFGLIGRILTEPMFLLLIGAVVLYLLLGDKREALVLAGSMLVIVTITLVQEQRTERALHALRDLSSPRAAVVRDGAARRIAGREVARGDIVLLSEGDRVPADGVLRASIDLAIDESLLTGESVAVDKHTDAEQQDMLPPEAGGGAFVYSGTLVVRGHGTAEILATGARTQLGRIGQTLATLKPEPTPLFLETRRLVRVIAVAGIGLCLVVTLLYALSRGGWVDAALAGTTLAMSVLPEEFPVVLTVFMALGAWRLSRRGLLTRRMPAIEALGAATVLAMDKTGTLTENRMSVAMLDDGTNPIELDGLATPAIDAASEHLLGVAQAACELDPFDPMERAISEATQRHAPVKIADLKRFSLVREYDLTPDLPAVTHVWQGGKDEPLRVAMKGAPEAVLPLCDLDAEGLVSLGLRVDALAHDGLRVLAVAETTVPGEALPESPRSFKLRFLGFVGLRDPVRKSVPGVLAQCRQAGIRVVMITGDHPQTARAVARAAGLDDGTVTAGGQLAAASDAELRALARDVSVFARTTPDQKLRLVRALRDNGEVVAMIGDGVNDAPALKAAHIGIAMGMRGTDVAREASALVLLDDELGSLVAAIGAGRQIYANVRSAMSYLLAVHLPLGGMGLAPLLFGWPLFLYPLHVAFLEFIIDPACSLVFEGERRGDGLMRQRPRDPRQRMFSPRMLLESLALGVTSLLAVAAVYAFALARLPANEARALGFVTLVVANLALILVNRSRTDSLVTVLARPNLAFWLVAVATSIALVIVVGVPHVAAAFRFAVPSLPAVMWAVLAAVVAVAWVGALKLATRPIRS